MTFRSQPRCRPTLSRRFFVPTLFAIGALFCTVQPVLADPIQYVLQGTFSGSLGSTTFQNAQGTFQFLGDSSNVVAEPGGYSNVLGTATFQLLGGSVATFQSASFGVESQYGAASFMDEQLGFAAGEYNEDTPGDVLSHPGMAYAGDFVSLDAPAATDRGDLSLTEGADVSFQAIAPAVAATPEPTSLLLLATGLVVGSLLLRQRAQQAG